ncbi:pimelyl-ACP methyl ester esterase BioV [Sulfurimonas sp.]|uniref:pimelyl-ACP methyl ester esterase BioV n=1 Tax=Sulfurimonas sp. TaxID=2022749 RepID=UPI00356A25F8
MQFFSGFSLQNESYLFDEYLNRSEYSVVGFSYGAIKAFNYAKEQLESGKRIDTLQLISPAFFQRHAVKFKKLQLLAYTKNELTYMNQFMNSCFDPYEKKIVEHKKTTKEELAELLNYEWNLQELQELVDKGIKLEVYLGEKDKIIDVAGAKEFFLQVATVTYIKEANHFLQIN